MTVKLIRVSNYARQNGVSTTTVYTWIKDKKIVAQTIDGVTFVEVKPN